MDALEKLSQLSLKLDRRNRKIENEMGVWPADLVTRGDQICGSGSCRLNITPTKQTRCLAAEIHVIFLPLLCPSFVRMKMV